ncbi:MAG: DUF4339 domain-containing protein [Planctomycetota bacterium]
MGIRFACYACGERLNIKRELAGKRGICPLCQARFRIPHQDTEFAQPVAALATSAATVGHAENSNDGVFTDQGPGVDNASEGPDVDNARGGTPDIDPLQILDSGQDATWYVRPPTGGQYGPADSETLRDWIGQGRVASNSLLWRDGWPQWRAASEAIPEWSGRFANSDSVGTNVHAPPLPQSATHDGVERSSASSVGIAGAGAALHGSALHGSQEVGEKIRTGKSRRILLSVVMSLIACGLIGLLVFLIQRA